MKNSPTIQEKLNAIVYLEIKELKDVLDRWFNEDKDRMSLSFGDNPDKMPAINLYGGSIDDIAHYAVKRIEVAHEGYYLVLNRNMSAYGDEFSEDENVYQYLDQDRENFIPGELSKLTKLVSMWTTPAETAYHFSKEQKAAIKLFNEAMDALDKALVYLFVDTENKQFVFANGVDGCLFDGSDGYMQTGCFTHVADIDTNRLPRAEAQYDTDFMDSDGIELVKEK